MNDIKSKVPKESRRAFLKGLILALNGIIALALAIPGLGYLLTPALSKDEEDWVKIGRTKDVPLGTMTKTAFRYVSSSGYVRAEKRSFAWMRQEKDGQITAFSPKCTHLGCNVAWNAVQRQFKCPCHGGVYDEQGNVIAGPPPKPLQRYLTKVEDGTVYLQRAEV